MSTTFLRQKPCIEWGVASRALPGQEVSGDLHVVKMTANGALAGVVDGLGHGEEATEVARIATAVLRDYAEESLISLVRRCHDALLSTRGAVMTVAAYNLLDRTVIALGIGNVEMVLLRADSAMNPPRESLLLRGGVVGYQLPGLHASVYPVQPGDLMVFCTDGINPGFADGIVVSESPQRIAERILDHHFRGNDDALTLVIRFADSRR
jgi:negative regulator of sigma-B (phosphoserine phosphatase)